MKHKKFSFKSNMIDENIFQEKTFLLSDVFLGAWKYKKKSLLNCQNEILQCFVLAMMRENKNKKVFNENMLLGICWPLSEIKKILNSFMTLHRLTSVSE